MFFDGSNHTELYAWEQSVNSTSISVWIKNYNSSSVIDMEVLAGSDNEFSATGYLEEAPQLSPIYGEYSVGATEGKIFPRFWDFANSTELSDFTYTYFYSGGFQTVGYNSLPQYVKDNITMDNGLYLTMNSTNGISLDYLISVSNTSKLFNYGYMGYMPTTQTGNNFIGIGATSGVPGIDFAQSEGEGTINLFRYITGQTTTTTASSLALYGYYTDAQYDSSNGEYNVTENVNINGITYTASSQNHLSTNTLTNAWQIGSRDLNGTSKPFYYFAVTDSVVMPTYTIGSGIPYLANSTTLDRVFYSYTSNYPSDPLYQIYTYDIPDSFSDNYISL